MLRAAFVLGKLQPMPSQSVPAGQSRTLRSRALEMTSSSSLRELPQPAPLPYRDQATETNTATSFGNNRDTANAKRPLGTLRGGR